MQSRENLNSWQQLTQHAQLMKNQHMKDLFAKDSQRFRKFSIKLPSILLDYSKNAITEETITLLTDLAKECEVEKWREKMFSGERINKTEDRAVLHTALRDRSKKPLWVDGKNISEDIEKTLKQVKKFSDDIRQGIWRGYSGERITDIVNIGVGGSNLGPQMVTEALKRFSDNCVNVHYVSNVDGTQIAEVLRPLNPEKVLFIVSSKTFTTTETMLNAKTAIKWLTASSFDQSAIAKHFIGVTANKVNAMKYGIAEANIFDMWDWVGGRFSLWSAIGLPIAINLGFDCFRELLDGAYEMDCHFCDTPIEHNIPVILALLSIWNCTFLGAQSQAILPYDQSLHMLSAYLQQAEMESNGKSVNWDGETINYPTVPSIWGELGINGQHAFYQYLHQSNNIVPADFIGSVESVTPIEGHHEALMSNFFAQTQALMQGVNEQQVRDDLTAKGRTPSYIDKVAPHKVHKGNRPTNTLLMNKISPFTLGTLIAIYEHKIFVQGIILQICSFDQWGVELGKGLASRIESELHNNSIDLAHDSSTWNLMMHYEEVKNRTK
ncbi:MULTISPECIES: glucose-6-phosphate isomerase [unclassified Colwellia]|uniref:glucose-6-phosphate isomerase n=1 Tax=unclassified Colwellia TaxID=196834 RepID=UPI0015F72FF6|nr:MULTISPECIES: glucose-6-phosphate isomerase [unclassified Colwellia]MBA6353620.1 glucose-6-phosphate isomerase [Colwellia sp. BRX9-1]MBA6356430.1 glucose-6-phosphate isomerase [Colwellia sp. BRX8-3]MBA6360153.1 glucose-6-phosphate isomerase [Colwellia sp. BRX8-6]MBA6368557.1 glucose-6-phosphate isomerase [Colwellia sp. BRX8-5]MBA6377142.1 glucose-6-phosphate isomerase [Colwellia sp. BRX8-2]